MTTQQRSPHFLILGAARAGTTWLCRMLAQHPEVAISDPKEPDFLVSTEGGPSYLGPGDEIIRKRVVSDEDAWRRLFTGHPESVRSGESSVSTLYFPHIAVERIEQFAPNAKLIVSLRAPWDRARSAHQLMRGKGLETLEFSDALAAEEDRRKAGWHPIWSYRSQSLFADQLEPFVQHFGDRLLVVEYERLVKDPSELQRIQEHIGVTVQPLIDPGAVNESVEPRSVLIRRVVRRLHSIPFVRR
ncbi:MAG: sulfotransferase, partial [Actinomycetota bacterium]